MKPISDDKSHCFKHACTYPREEGACPYCKLAVPKDGQAEGELFVDTVVGPMPSYVVAKNGRMEGNLSINNYSPYNLRIRATVIPHGVRLGPTTPTAQNAAADLISMQDSSRATERPTTSVHGDDPAPINVGGNSYEASMLRNLLARIHGDGGHYLAEHGLDKALEDADALVANWRAAQNAAKDEVSSKHQFSSAEMDRHLLVAYTPTRYNGDYPEYFNLTMLRNDGSVVLTVRLPTVFGGPQGEVSSVRFDARTWREFVRLFPEVVKMYDAVDFLDGQM